MSDVIITGASRGIGRALALEVAAHKNARLVVCARDHVALDAVVLEAKSRGSDAVAVAGDLGSLRRARALGRQLAERIEPGATLVHNAGIWPSKRVLNEDGLESAFCVNHVGAVEMQGPLLAAGLVRRVMVVSAGLIALGRFDSSRTPTGRDFSIFRTYCTTKLCFAVTTRDIAAEHPEVDFVVLHPGVVRTDLGARAGMLGRLLSLAKQAWEPPELCAKRLAGVLAAERWSPPGNPKWLDKTSERPWPSPAQDPDMRRAIRQTTAAFALPTES